MNRKQNMNFELKNGSKISVIICGNPEILKLGEGRHLNRQLAQWVTIMCAIVAAEESLEANGVSSILGCNDYWDDGNCDGPNRAFATASKYVVFDGDVDFYRSREDYIQAIQIADTIAKAFEKALKEATAL